MIKSILLQHRSNLAAALVAFLFTLMLWHSGTPNFINRKNAQEKEPDIYIEQLLSKQFNTLGQTEYRLRARSAQHWPDSDETTLVEPHIMYYAPQVWYTHAHNGIIHPQGAKITFENGVNMHRESGSAQLLTPYLTIDTNAKIASTSAQVVVETPGGVTNARGLRVDMASDKITLLNNVLGNYHPNNPVAPQLDQATIDTQDQGDEVTAQSEKTNAESFD